MMGLRRSGIMTWMMTFLGIESDDSVFCFGVYFWLFYNLFFFFLTLLFYFFPAVSAAILLSHVLSRLWSFVFFLIL